MKVDYTKIEDFLDVELAQDRINSWIELTAGQYRINNELDIYPRRRKYFFVPTQERGEYKNLEDLIDLLYH